MNEPNESITGLDERLEHRMLEAIAEKKSDIEKSLSERIAQEQENARKRIEALEQEFEKDRNALDRHNSFVASLNEARTEIETRILGHIDKARHCGNMIRNMVGLAGDECRKAEDLFQEVEGLRRKSKDEADLFQTYLRDRYGIDAPVLNTFATEGIRAEIEIEKRKLEGFRELLSGAEAGTMPGEPAPVEDALPAETESLPSVEIPADHEPEEADFLEIPSAPIEETDSAADPDSLRQYGRDETISQCGAVRIFQKDRKKIIDGESILSQISASLAEAGKLQDKLSQTESPKEQFFVKREILDQQEFLRKFFLCAVKLCEKESFELPRYTSEVLNVQTFKDILGLLNMANWSDAGDLDAFQERVNVLKASFQARIATDGDYHRSLLEQLEAR
ncbi:MAG: hypothetical protein ACYDH0_05605 [Candidatus Aminicenantales bacterium]